VLESGSLDEALATAQSVQPSLIILEWEADSADAGLHKIAHGMGEGRVDDVPIIVVADEEEALGF
jgi:hypothetical protein